MSNYQLVPYPSLMAAIEGALAGAGVPEHIHRVEAEIMAEADLCGVPSHGIRMLPTLLTGLRDGRANPAPQLRVVRSRASSCVIDGDNGPGRWVSAEAMQHAVDYAQQSGIGACLATRVTHWGRAHAYATRAALQGCVGICTTNAMPAMVAWGSTVPLLANNPLAIAVPTGDRDPVVLDMAMSQAAVGKIGTAQREGRRVPTSWGLDETGSPTDDPAAMLRSRRLLPFGNHKGAGLSLMMELITGALAGGMLSQEIGAIDGTGLDPQTTKLFIALDVSAFVASEIFVSRVGDMLTWLRNAEPGVQVTFPGERGWSERERRLAEGIPIHQDIVAQLKKAGVELPHLSG